MAAEEEATRDLSSHEIDGGAKSFLITLGASAWWRSTGARLTEGKIATEYGQARRAECVSKGRDERRVAIASRAMRQDEAVRSRDGRQVKESSHGQIPN
jgi:hypothetical protein